MSKTKVDPQTDWTEGSPENRKLSRFEDKLYEILHKSMERADAAARASARIEADLLQEMESTSFRDTTLDPERLIEESEPESATGPEKTSSGEFDSSGFGELFYNLNAMRTVRELLSTLGIEDLDEQIMATLIDSAFGQTKKKSGPRGAAAPQVPPTTEMIAGGDMGVMLHNMRKEAERKQRQDKRNKNG